MIKKYFFYAVIGACGLGGYLVVGGCGLFVSSGTYQLKGEVTLPQSLIVRSVSIEFLGDLSFRRGYEDMLARGLESKGYRLGSGAEDSDLHVVLAARWVARGPKEMFSVSGDPAARPARGDRRGSDADFWEVDVTYRGRGATASKRYRASGGRYIIDAIVEDLRRHTAKTGGV